MKSTLSRIVESKTKSYEPSFKVLMIYNARDVKPNRKRLVIPDGTFRISSKEYCSDKSDVVENVKSREFV